ncbi:hypothetical protein [Bordetella sp. LUAb4]|uniref:hypothetical protein n=1 Tax=Bordetella sp. LUAb4 TaxID=2843195 RepID=UPI001E475A91|nr:hypothetical protein [Bordetella sp. LUAb4]
MPDQHPSQQVKPKRFTDTKRFFVFILAYLASLLVADIAIRFVYRSRLIDSAQFGYLVEMVILALFGYLAAIITAPWGPPLTWGRPSKRSVIRGLALVTLFCPTTVGLDYLFNIPTEPALATSFFADFTASQNVYILVAMIVAGPISLQIKCSQLLFNAFPWEKRPSIATLAAIAAATFSIYMTVWPVYVNTTTYISEVAFCLICIGARYFSKGMLLPIILNAYGAALMLILLELFIW